jgi:hypothetical protein
MAVIRKRKATTQGKRTTKALKRAPVYRSRQFIRPYSITRELKYDQNTVFIANISTTGHIVNLLTVANGTGPNERIGQSINLAWFKAKIRFGTAANNSGNVLTISFVYDRQTNGALPAITDVFTTTDPIALPNPTNTSRFDILWQKTVQTAQSAAGGVDTGFNAAAPFDVYFPFRGRKAQYLGTTNAITDIDSGSFFMIITCSNNNVNSCYGSECIKYYE